jgi:hypothetical protein
VLWGEEMLLFNALPGAQGDDKGVPAIVNNMSKQSSHHRRIPQLRSIFNHRLVTETR